MPANPEQNQPEQQSQRMNYHEEKFRDGMVKERSWETPEGKKITEGVGNRGYWKIDLEKNRGKTVHNELITEAYRSEQDPDTQEIFVQYIKYSGSPPVGVHHTESYKSDNPYVEIKGSSTDKNGYRIRGKATNYIRALYPNGEQTVFGDEEGRRFVRDIWFEEATDGWKKTQVTTQVEREVTASHLLRNKLSEQHEELLQKDQLPPLPDPNNPNGFSSLDAIPEEYYITPPF
jgi:hypothetical protein